MEGFRPFGRPASSGCDRSRLAAAPVPDGRKGGFLPGLEGRVRDCTDVWWKEVVEATFFIGATRYYTYHVQTQFEPGAGFEPAGRLMTKSAAAPVSASGSNWVNETVPKFPTAMLPASEPV